MAKYDSMRKVERNRALYEYHLSHPDFSLREVAKPFNISRERARKIIQSEKKKILTSAVAKGVM